MGRGIGILTSDGELATARVSVGGFFAEMGDGVGCRDLLAEEVGLGAWWPAVVETATTFFFFVISVGFLFDGLLVFIYFLFMECCWYGGRREKEFFERL
ncbi:hypothetical protein RJT34_12175 [Clitoria ternatea]|uniref:Uncharacterized protein n=1 Tax=Clitoria ternatea TaxID=43366 RepID=A0AAN9JPW0_CLITE